MTSELARPISVILDGKNYSQWSYHMKIFLKGRGLWKYVTGDKSCPIISVVDFKNEEKKAKWETDVDQWEIENNKIMTWIANTVDHSISLQFNKFETAKAIWDYLSNRYNQTNFALKYKLEMDIRNIKQLPGQPISDFYNQMSIIWDQLALMEPKWTVDATLYEQYREETRLVQFLMALRDDFEGVRGSMFYRTPLPTVDSALAELIAEETRKGLTHAPKPTEPVVFATPSWKSEKLSQIQCNYCKKLGHMVKDCPQPSSNNMRTKMKTKGYPKQNIAAGAAQFQSEEDPNSGTALPQPSQLFTADDIQNIIRQALSNSGTASSTNPTLSGMRNSNWLLDSGASNHMTYNHTVLSQSKPLTSPSVIYTADGSPASATHFGSIRTDRLSVSEVLFIPKLSMNLLSVGQLCESGLTVTFNASGCVVQDCLTGKEIGRGRKDGRLYQLEELHVPVQSHCHATVSSTATESPFISWHKRLGHVSFSKLSQIINNGVLGSVPVVKEPGCIHCNLSKHHALPFNISSSTTNDIFDLIHSDIWGPAPIPTMGGARYYVIFVDDYTRFTWVYLLHHRSDFLQIYKEFSAMIKTQFSKTIKIFRSDSGGEYLSHQFREVLKTQGTISQLSCVETPQQNGVSERKHRHIVETARTLLLSSSVPKEFWGEAVHTSVYLIN